MVTSKINKKTWSGTPNSGATNHVTVDATDIQHMDLAPSADDILIANGNKLFVFNLGNSSICIGPNCLQLNNILHIPEVKKNLLLINKLCNDNNISVTFDNFTVCFKDRNTNKELLTRGVADGLYQLKLGDEHLLMVNLGVKAPFSIWHAHLGHNNERTTKEIVKDFGLPLIESRLL